MHFLRYKYLMTPNQLLKNALSVLTLYRGIVPADQFNKSVQPVINDIRNYLADQIEDGEQYEDIEWMIS